MFKLVTFSIQYLPLEIIELIFTYVPRKEKLKLRLICKKWKEIFESSFDSRKLLHLRISGWEVSKSETLNFLAESTTCFNQLSLIQAELHDIPKNVWENIGRNLRVLTFRYCLKMGIEDFHKILNFCSNVEELQIFDHFPPLGPGYKFKTYLSFSWNVSNVKRFEMFRASAVDNQKLQDFVTRMTKLEYLRIESAYLKRMEESILDICEKRDDLRSLLLVDISEVGGYDFLFILNRFQIAKLNRYGCRLIKTQLTPELKKFLELNTRLQYFEVWISNEELDPKFLYDVFQYSSSLKKLIIHCDQLIKPFTRNEVELYQKRKLKKIVFFPD
ncbi:uncharacterized protein LOC134834953 [Culicoides brevitarsis]|uniref:uncharacterized protein LOC134834953 n=1 Tax=Culicoides brevitarsis TaxID=469753 RepID=UPI00307C7C55